MMILLAAWGLLSLCRLLWGRSHVVARLLAVLLIIATGINYGLLFKTMSDLHPYEYSYFNELVGGVAGAGGSYDTDYWRICSKPAAQWLAAHYRSLTKNPHPTATASFSSFQIMLYLPPAFSQDDVHPDFYIGSTNSQADQLFPSYTIIHTERIIGQTPVCAQIVSSPNR